MGIARLLGLLILLSPLPAHAGQLLGIAFPSAVLGRDYRLQVYLPDDYARGAGRYSVLYMLHGSNGTERDWVDRGDILTSLDHLIASRQIPPMVVVMPGHSYGWWVDGNREKGETAFLQEVIPYVESTFRVYNTRAGRLIAGLSAGGYGTVNLILKHPDMFAAAAAFSPAVYTPLPPPTSSAQKHHPFQKDGAFDGDTWTRLNWPRWFPAYKEAGITVPIYINSGDHDYFDIAYHAAVLYQKFREIQPAAAEFRVVGGDHGWTVWSSTFPDAARFMGQYAAPPGP
jgi:Predicted esterase